MSNVTFTAWRSVRPGRRILTTVLVVLGAFALVWIGRASAQEGEREPAASKSISTNISKADAVDATDFVCTTSTAFTNMPGMLVSFKSGGTASRPVIVLFQGEWESNRDIGRIRLTIDGIVQSGPDDVEMNPFATDSASTHGFNFLSDLLAPGLHVARIQWRSVFGTTACVQDRSLIVMHK